MAQFSHADFGGRSPGMSMVGDVFNNQLKLKLDALCTDIAAHLEANDVASGGLRSPSNEVLDGKFERMVAVRIGAARSGSSQGRRLKQARTAGHRVRHAEFLCPVLDTSVSELYEIGLSWMPSLLEEGAAREELADSPLFIVRNR
jgi:hypothetical protein